MLEFRRMGRQLQMNSNNFELKVIFHKLKKEYNKMLKMTKNMFFKSIIEQLDTLHENDPKAFWKTLDHIGNNTTHNSNPIPVSS